ncbi:MAG TPA: hypothetical protein VKE25_07225 [Actinomycetes bacterium]|nr:hypothetical protein [Actinomycetes bacterium]
MPAKKATHTSPTLNIDITPEQYDRAVKSDSGACLIADAIKAQHPHLSSVSVDMATIRVSDRKRGLRFVYLTPPEAQHVLLSFDQGWSNPTEKLTIKRAVRVQVITRNATGPKSNEGRAERREAKKTMLEAKVAAGEELTRGEKSSLRQLQKPYEPIERPASQPPVTASPGGSVPTVVGGQPMVQGPSHPNLLRGRKRHFGAKVSSPGVQWTEAIEQAVEERIAQREQQS